MKSRLMKIESLFKLIPGAFHATSELEPGTVPLISCGEENNGLIGHYNIPLAQTHQRALTVAFNGFPLTTNYHPYRFGAKDDVAILVPLEPMSDGVLIYIAARLNEMKWRYSYGRKCYREKLKNVEVPLPAKGSKIDATIPDAMLREAFGDVRRSVQESLDALFQAPTP